MTIFYDVAHWIIISVLIIASLTPQGALAQSEEETWAVPVNLSHSGATKNPSIVIDSDATMHAIWQDEFSGFIYARFDGNQWSAPRQTDLHLLFGSPVSQGRTTSSEESVFTSTNPLFIAGPGQFIFAVWVTQEGVLYADRVANNSFDDISEWDTAQLLSSSVTTFTAGIDMYGELHVAYIRTDDDTSNPAGIYYRRSEKNGRDWTNPDLLYESTYFSTLDSAKENIALTIAGTVDAPLVYVVWDNRPRKQLFLAKSIDGGASWEPAMVVAGPVPDSGLNGPFGIRVGAQENSIVLIWQNGQPEGICTQYFQSSNDAGVTWSEVQLMFDDLPGCVMTNEFVPVTAVNPGKVLLLLTISKSQTFLSAWNGLQWSVPQAQPILSSFEDPEIYTQVEYDCQRAALFDEQLYVIGCDSGGGGDIWVTSLTISSTTSWFSPPIWSQPALVTSDSLAVEAVEMVATGDNLIHAFFSQRADSSVYYTRWDGTSWARFAPVLELPDGKAGQPAVAAGPGDELFLIARSSTGSLYFSRAKSSEAVTPSSWSTPVQLPTAHEGGISPADVAWDAGGTVYIAYSVPVNDGRGVYLIQSKDRGETWSEPLQVFNGEAAGFEVVGSPSLQVMANGLIYIMWKQESIPADGVSQSISLYFARSEDGGQSFGKAERVVEAPVVWQKFMTDSKGNLHRLWQRFDMLKTLYDQVSFDGGYSWQSPELFPTEGGIATVTADNVGRSHLVSLGQGIISYWLWDGSHWQAEPPTHWSPVSQANSPVEALAASVDMNGKMVVILVAPTSSGDRAEENIFYITRTNYPPSEITTQVAPNQSTPSPTITPTIAPTEDQLTAATTINIGSARPLSPVENLDTNNLISLLTEVLLPLLILLISVLVVVYLRVVWSKSR